MSQCIEVERFEDVILGPEIDRLQGGRNVAEGRDDDDIGLGVLCLEQLAEFNAIEPRQFHIADHQGSRHFLKRRKSILGI